MYIYIYIHICNYTYVYVCIYMYIYAHTHVHTHSSHTPSEHYAALQGNMEESAGSRLISYMYIRILQYTTTSYYNIIYIYTYIQSIHSCAGGLLALQLAEPREHTLSLPPARPSVIIYIYIYMYKCMYIMYTYLCVYLSLSLYIYIYMYIHIYIYIYIYIYILLKCRPLSSTSPTRVLHMSSYEA